MRLLPSIKFTPKETTNAMHTSERAKLDLAVEHGLRAKFVYTNESGETHDVRLEPDDVYLIGPNAYVAGESYDENGDTDGYKQYRLDRIQSPVTVR